MSRAYSMDLRLRVIEAIDRGLSTRPVAARFSIGIATAGSWHRLWRRTGSAAPRRKGNPGGSRLDAHRDFIQGLLDAKRDIALYEIAERLAAERGIEVHASTIWYVFNREGITHKKRPRTQPSRSVKM